VVEAEQVVSKVDKNGNIDWILTEEADIIDSQTVGFKRSYTLPYEIHFILDIPGTEKLPFPLETLMSKCTESGLRMGGWFVSKKEDHWGYKSNNFAMGATKKIILDSWNLMKKIVGLLWTGEYSLTCLVERILGVWNAKNGLGPCAQDVKDADELASWERNILDLNEMWVVTPNFLGDKSDVVFRAMMNNLQRRVRYRYFVNSYADACRWQKLVQTLLRRVPYIDKSLEDLMSAVILWRPSNGAEYFIAHTRSGIEGYCLKRFQHGEVYEGKLMSADEVKQVVTSLQVLTEPHGCINVSGYMHAPLKHQQTLGHLLRIRFHPTEYNAEKIRDRENQIGELVSKHGGEFSSTYEGDYLCVFFYAESQENAVRFCKNLMKLPVVVRDKPLVLFQPGYISREMRVRGFEFVGPAVEWSRKKLNAKTQQSP